MNCNKIYTERVFTKIGIYLCGVPYNYSIYLYFSEYLQIVALLADALTEIQEQVLDREDEVG